MTKDLVLGLHSELDEVLDELNWKGHRGPQRGGIIRANLLEECVDVLKFSLSLFTTWGFSADEIADEFERKSAVVEQRYRQELRLPEDGLIVGVDIDGVLADYPRAFVDWAADYMGLLPIDEEPDTLDMGEWLGVDGETLIMLKHEWRESGLKRYMPVCTGATELLVRLVRKHKVVLLSARPYKEHKRIFADTMEWLDTNGLLHDAVLFDENKNERLLREYGADRIAFFIEDNREQANRMASCGVSVYLLDRPYNQGDTHEGVTRVDRLESIR
jgi:uncharacterized HAD superfamily protein